MKRTEIAHLLPLIADKTILHLVDVSEMKVYHALRFMSAGLENESLKRLPAHLQVGKARRACFISLPKISYLIR